MTRTKKRPEIDATTGIDCITCHFDGNRVVTGKDFKLLTKEEENCPVYCKPVASGFFSSNKNCQPCHVEQYEGVEEFNQANKGVVTCRSCHEEKNAQGKYTHYTYWAHDAKGKTEPENLNLFNGISVSYQADKNAVKVTWSNKYMPHKISECTEMVAFVEVKDGNKVLANDTLRSNRRVRYMEEGKHTTFDGKTGYEFKGLNDELDKIIMLPKSSGAKNYTVSVKGIKKEQFWISDSISTLHFSKTFKL